MNSVEFGNHLETLSQRDSLQITLFADIKRRTKLIEIPGAKLVKNGNLSKLIFANSVAALKAFSGIKLYREEDNLILYIYHSEGKNAGYRDGEVRLKIVNLQTKSRMSLTIK